MLLAQESFPSRQSLGRRVCEEFSFLDPLGRPQIAICLKALISLAAQSPDIRLPPPSASAIDNTPRLLPGGVAEAMASPPTREVSVCDREGDIRDLLQSQHERADRAGLLVRSNGTRQRQVLLEDGRVVALREQVESLNPVIEKEVVIAAQGGKRARKKRTAQEVLRIARVQLKAPESKAKNQGPDRLPVIAVSVKEDQPPADIQSPLNWLLLCTEGEADAGNALRICQWYETRWGIEEYFLVLKSGCTIQQRQFHTTQALLMSMVFDAITAWRVFDLQRRAKREPNTPANEVVEPEELELCQLLLHNLYPRLTVRAPPDLTIR